VSEVTNTDPNMGNVLTTDEEGMARPVTGFALWSDDDTNTTELFCPPCWVGSNGRFIREHGEDAADLMFQDRCDWLHAGGPKVVCHTCGREVN